MTSNAMKSILQYFVDWVHGQPGNSLLPEWWDEDAGTWDLSYPAGEEGYFRGLLMDLVTAKCVVQSVKDVEYLVSWIAAAIHERREARE